MIVKLSEHGVKHLEYLKVDNFYHVYGVIIHKNYVEFRLLTEWNHLVDVKGEFLDVINRSIPIGWSLYIEDDVFRIWPSLFEEKYFQEEFNDCNSIARSKFERIRIASEI
jgi:hypothetical protein